jgi:hypothetical protein
MFANCCEAGFDLGDEEAKLIAKVRCPAVGAYVQPLDGEAAFRREATASAFGPKILSGRRRGTGHQERVDRDRRHPRRSLPQHSRQGGAHQNASGVCCCIGGAESGAVGHILFPTAFAHYLKSHTFANFDPVDNRGSAGSRHAVGHGAAAAETYTMIRALQALLTLDQLAFYT